MNNKPGSVCRAIAVVSLAIGLLIAVLMVCGGAVSWVMDGFYSSDPANYHIWHPHTEAALLRSGCIFVFCLAVSAISGAAGYLIARSAK